MNTDRDAFETFTAATEPRLRRALVLRYGVEMGNDACADALAYGWEHWADLRLMANPAGYLFRVAQSHARRYTRWRRRDAVQPPAPAAAAEHDSRLHAALRALTPDQRVAVVLVHGYGYSYADAAATLDIPISTLRNHISRGMKRLRTTMED